MLRAVGATEDRAMALYDAFISYSHAKDKPIAAALQSVIQTLGKPWYKRRALRIFRDDTSLSATPHLWPTIESGLSESRYLVLMASPEAARSQWVGKEISHWLEHKSIDTLLIAVTDGELSWQPGASDFTWNDATPLPPALKGKFPAEPKWVDLRGYREGASKRDRKFAELGANFAAAIRGVPKEDLLSEEVRQQRRALTLAWSAIALLAVLGSAALWQYFVAVGEKRIAVAQQQIAQQQRDRAEQTLHTATNSADDLISDLAIKIRNVRGVPIEVIQHILQNGKGLLDGLLSFNETSPAIQLIRVSTGSELGFTLAQENSPDGGKLATQAYQSAKLLAQSNPDLPGMDYALGRAAEVMGQLTERTDAKAGYAYYSEANDAYGKCLTKNAKDPDCLNHEFMTLGRIGNVLDDAKRYNDAMSMYQKSLQLAQSYAQLVPPGPEVGEDLGGRYDHIGRIYFETNDLNNAMTQFTQAQNAMEPWMNDPGASASFMVELSNAYNNIGNVLATQANAARDRNKLQQAIAFTEKAEAILQSLADGDPSNVFYWSNLSVDDYNLSVLNASLGNKSAQQAYAAKSQQAQQRAQAKPASTAQPSPPAQQQ
jgi:tetratricopeptide (TPR) repeat protein